MQNFDQIFSDLDLDNDNKLSIQDSQKVLEQLQISFYPGMVQSLIDNNLLVDTMSREALKAYCSYTLSGFKVLHQLDLVMKDFCNEISSSFINANKTQSAGASPSSQIQYRQQNIKLKLQVGPDNSFNTNINVQLNKFKDKTFQKPSIKFMFFPQSNKSNQVVEILKQMITTIKDTLINQLQQFANLINAIDIQVYQQADHIVLEFSSECQELLKTLENMIQMPDNFFSDQLTEGTIKLSLSTGLDFVKIFENNQKNILDYLGSFFSFSVDYHGNPTLLKIYEQLGVTTLAFHGCKSSIGPFFKQYFLPICCGTLEDVDIDLRFNNIYEFYSKLMVYSNQLNHESQVINNDTISALIEGIVICQNDEFLSFIPKFLQLFYNNCISKLQVHVEISKAQLDMELSVQNLGYLYKKVLQRKESQNN